MQVQLKTHHLPAHQNKGLPLVLLHGWGIDSSIWQPCLEQLRLNREIYLLDMPGYGINRAAVTIDEQVSLIDSVANWQMDLPETYLLVGFSLGGIVASRHLHTKFNGAVGLVTIGTNRCFVSNDKWRHGVPPDFFEDFLGSLQADKVRLMKRFCSLQCEGLQDFRASRQALLKLIDPRLGLPVLKHGLKALGSSDLTEEWADIAVPILHQFGRLDRLVPVSAAESLMSLRRNVEIFDHSAHLPFVQETDNWVASVERFTASLM